MFSASPTVELSASELHAMVLLTQGILLQLDEVAALKRRRARARLSTALLGEMCGVLREMDARMLTAYYYVLLVSTTHHLGALNAEFDQEYIRYSAPSKQRLIRRIREGLLSAAA